MAVEVRTSEFSSEVELASLSGRLDMETAEADSPQLMQAVQRSAAGVIVDLQRVDFISSSGLRMLLAAHKSVQESDKRLAVIHAQPAVYKIFKVSALDGLFHFCQSEEEAVEAIS